ncbi:hypothetical protein BDA99DRAFT_426540, partial [Phascolomyces articulosus]
FQSTKAIHMKEGDYDGRSIQSTKNIDAMGVLKTRNNMELITVWAPSSMLKERTTHTIEDVMKILECSVSSLKKEAGNYKMVLLETFEKLNIYGIQVIRTKVTLSRTCVNDKDSWKHVEIRLATLPTTWHE